MSKLVFISLLFCAVLAGAPPTVQASTAPAASNTAAHDAAGDLSDAVENATKDHDPARARWSELDAKIHDFDLRFSSQPRGVHYLVMLRKQQLTAAKRWNETAVYDGVAGPLSRDKRPEVVAMMAMLAQLQAQPVQLSCISLDGRAIDLSRMRGRVVLVDFWATWCPPCREEVPRVVAAYAQYHARGLEIVGVSLDEDKGKLLSFIQNHRMTWPQYFDGKVWDNAVSKSFGIDSIPAMWLIGKDGKLITMDASSDLGGNVAKALQGRSRQ